MSNFEKFISERENFVFSSLNYLEPVEIFENRSNMMKFRSFGGSTMSRVGNRLRLGD